MIRCTYYTYYETKIKVIGFVPYKRLCHYIRRYGRKKRIYFTTIWVNSFVNIMLKSKLEIDKRTMYQILKKWNVDLEDQYLLDTINYYTEDKPHFYVMSHFEWNEDKIWDDFDNILLMKNYKRKIRNVYSGKVKSDTKTKVLMDFYEYDRSIYYGDMLKKVKHKMCEKTMKKILNENEIVLEKKSKSFSKIEQKLEDLFKYRIDSVKQKITYELLSDYCGVSRRTLIRFLNINVQWKQKISDFNKTV